MPRVTKPDFHEYYTDSTGRTHILNVFCKCCGRRIQTGYLMKNHLNVKVPVLAPGEDYVDLYVAFEDEKGTLRRKSTPMCAKCASEDFSLEDLEAIHEADTCAMKERHKQSGVRDENVDKALEARCRMKMRGKIGFCVPGYAIVGEGK